MFVLTDIPKIEKKLFGNYILKELLCPQVITAVSGGAGRAAKRLECSRDLDSHETLDNKRHLLLGEVTFPRNPATRALMGKSYRISH